MNVEIAEVMAKRLMREHGLNGWKFSFHNRRNSFGTCSYGRRTIFLSRPLVSINDVEHVKDTILHEIAHALTPGHGHDYVWVQKAREIGCNGERCFNDESGITMPEFRYIAECPGCGKVSGVNRTLKRQKSCGKCDSVFNPKFILNFKPNPKVFG